MMKMTKMLLVVALLFSTAFSSLADRGIGKRSKNKVDFNITTSNSLRNSLYLNLHTGLKYTGSLLTRQQANNNTLNFNNLVTFQKGNTVYIIPYKHIVAVPEIATGYTGMKLIIRPH